LNKQTQQDMVLLLMGFGSKTPLGIYELQTSLIRNTRWHPCTLFDWLTQRRKKNQASIAPGPDLGIGSMSQQGIVSVKLIQLSKNCLLCRLTVM
jgi:hypothetical protein